MNDPINDLEQAKKYFIAMGCSHFHMTREYPQRAKEYRALDIDPKIESEWIKEEFEKILEDFYSIQPSEYGSYLRSLDSMIERKAFYLEKLLDLTKRIISNLPLNQIDYVLSSIIGNNATITKGGLIYKSYSLNRKDLAYEFYKQARFLINLADENSIQMPSTRGDLLDLIDYYKIDENQDYLKKLRDTDNLDNFNYSKRGAEEGNKYSMKRLSENYRDGKGCAINSEKAKYWEQKAKE